MTDDITFQKITDRLFSLIPKDEFEEKWDSIGELSPSFLGIVDIYFYLSQEIPKDWTVIDFGAAHNAQSYFFTDHKEYIAVEPDNGNPDDNGMFCPPNCRTFRMTTGEFLKTQKYPREKVFAICNYVPNWFGEDSIDLVHKNFRNCYTFYPEI